MRLLDAEALIARTGTNWLVHEVLPQGGVSMIVGSSGAGKSFLSIDLAMTLAGASTHWFGHRVRHCPVVYLALEGEGGLGRRVAAYRKERGEVEGVKFGSGSYSLLDRTQTMGLAEMVHAADMSDGLIIVDTLARASSGADENLSSDMGRIIEGAYTLSALSGCGILLVHHLGKDRAAGPRGHSSLHAAVDSVIAVERDGHRRGWYLLKSKDGGDECSHGFRLHQVPLGQDEMGEAVTSCVVAEITAEEADEARTVRLDSNSLIVWEVIGALLKASTKYGMGQAPAGRPCVELEDAVAAAVGGHPGHPDKRDAQVRTSISRLIAAGKLTMTEGWIYAS